MFGLNKLADRDFVIGFVLPILIAYLAAAGLFHDYLPSLEFIAKLAEDKSFASLTVVVLAVWTGATVLMALNRTLYRLLEGYSGPLAKDRWRNEIKEKRRQQLAVLKFKYEKCKFNASPNVDDQINEARRGYVFSRTQFLMEFPSDALVMPTRFGNVIRAFENYPNEVYKLDGIAGWSRLVGVLPSNYVSIINDAHAEVDFWVNCCCLAVLLAAAAVGRVMYALIQMIWCDSKLFLSDFWYAVFASVAIYLSLFAYNCATERAVDWGNSVKAAFDLYLPALAKQLGYELPRSRSGSLSQDEFWDSVTAMFLVQTPLRSEEWKVISSSEVKSGEAKLDSGDKDKPSEAAEGEDRVADDNCDASREDDAQGSLPLSSGPSKDPTIENGSDMPRIA